jgi:hypothetical protein
MPAHPPKTQFERYLRSILASRFFTISALIHLGAIFLFGGTVLFNKYVEPPDFQAVGTGGDPGQAAEPPQQPDATLPPTPVVSTVPPAPTTPSLAVLASANPSSNSAFNMPLPAMVAPTINKAFSNGPATSSFGTGGFVGLPGSMKGRGNPGNAGQQYGEKPASEQAVLAALRWLQTQQNTDGSWGSDPRRGAFTGLALLCYLGHGETPQTSREFGMVVSKAIDALVAEGLRNEGRFSFGNGFDGNEASYQHGIATYALCEAYTMTKDPRLPAIIKQAIDYIVKGQRPDGGWAYSYNQTPDGNGTVWSDTSVSGWQIQALKAAHLTGIPGMSKIIGPVFAHAMDNLDRVWSKKNGSFGYRIAQDDGYSLTGVGVLSKFFWQGREDKEIREGLKNIQSKDLDYQGPECDLFAWYYDTQACYQAQGGPWDWWKNRFQKQLTANQSPDGSWPPNTGKDAGGLNALPGGDGPVYRTTLCCLMLEVFYRYLPTSRESSLSTEIQGL